MRGRRSRSDVARFRHVGMRQQAAQRLRDREGHVAVRDVGEDLLDQALAEERAALGLAARADCTTRKHGTTVKAVREPWMGSSELSTVARRRRRYGAVDTDRAFLSAPHAPRDQPHADSRLDRHRGASRPADKSPPPVQPTKSVARTCHTSAPPSARPARFSTPTSTPKASTSGDSCLHPWSPVHAG